MRLEFAQSEAHVGGVLKPVYTRAAQKAVGAMPKGDAAQLVSRISTYAADPTTPNIDVDTVKGRPGVYRIRWGRWRALFRVEDSEMRIYQLEHRREVYR